MGLFQPYGMFRFSPVHVRRRSHLLCGALFIYFFTVAPCTRVVTSYSVLLALSTFRIGVATDLNLADKVNRTN